MSLSFRPWLLPFALVCATLVSLPSATTAFSGRDLFFLEFTATSSESGIAQVFFDLGRGTNERDSSHTPIQASVAPLTTRLPLPLGEIRALRFDPMNHSAAMTLARVRVVDANGKTIQAFTPAEILPLNQISKLSADGTDGVALTMPPDANDPSVTLAMPSPLQLANAPRYWLWPVVKVFSLTLVLSLVVGSLPWRRWWDGPAARVCYWSRQNPAWALCLTAVASVAVQCHPVIFFGRSFLAPDNGAYLLYDSFPTLPGYHTTVIEDTKEADVGAMMWQHSSYPRLQREAIFEHAELPLWNRYDLCGVPLLGQGQSMFGDPMNIITMFCDGAAWAWDARFVAMRVLFAFGVGLVVLVLVAELGPALLVTACMPFLGFFAFRLNHPAILSVCWSPWILVAWCWLWRAQTARTFKIAVGGLAGFHLCLLASGTVKEAAMSAACLDLAGFLLVVLANISWREKLTKLTGALFAGVVFTLISAPIWLTFLTALAKSRTNYDEPGAVQFPPWQILGFFDDLFYRQFRGEEAQVGPSTNFVLLFGFVWCLVNVRTILVNPRLRAISLATLVPLAFVFKGVPAALIVKLPFVANIIHVANTFSCPLIVLTAVLAGFGFSFARRQFVDASFGKCYLGFIALLAIFASAYFVQARFVPKSPFFIGYIASLLAVVILLPPVLRLARNRANVPLIATTLTAAFVLLLWRHSQYLSSPFDAYVFNPQTRVNLAAHSPAVDFINGHSTPPSRTVGLGYILFPGYHQVLRWESIYGVDAVRNRYIDELAVAAPLRKVYDWGTGPIEQQDVGNELPLQDMMNVRFYLARHEFSIRSLPGRTLQTRTDLDIFESPTVWPRAFFTSSVDRYPSTQSFIASVLAGDHRPVAFIQDTERDLPDGVSLLPTNRTDREITPASDFATTTNTTRFTVTTHRAGVIVLSESYYPRDFRVTVNGAATPYFRVNHAFKGIYVPNAGTYRVEFSYWPERLSLALCLAAAGGVIALLAGWGRLNFRAFPSELPMSSAHDARC